MTKSTFTRRQEQFLRILVAARHDAGLTQVTLARKLGRPQSFVSKYERGERRLDLIEFLEVADGLSLDPVRIVKDLQRR